MCMPELIGQSNEGYKMLSLSKEPEAQVKRGWKLEINGIEVKEPIESVRLVNSRMGVEALYGQRPEGYDGPILKEPGGGGSVTIPYYLHNGQLYIGVVEEERLTCTDGTKEKVLNVPRGFLDSNQTHFETAKQELKEETGYEPMEKRIKELSGRPTNPNSAFFITGKDKGVRMYGVEVNDMEVAIIQDSDNPFDREFTFNPQVIKPTSKMGERIGRSRFIHWTKATEQIDMFTVAGVARILASTQTFQNH